MVIQKLEKSSKEEMRTLFKQCFNSMFDSQSFDWFIDSDELWRYIWGVKKDGVLIASYIAYEGEVKFRKIPFKINFFDGVVSKPGERGKGMVREMLNHHVMIAENDSIELLLLDPFKTSFYEALGYTTAIDMAKYEIPFELIRKPESKKMGYEAFSGFVSESEPLQKKIREILKMDWEHANYNPMKIPDCYIRKMLMSKLHQTCIFEENGIPRGYILYTVENRVLSIRRIIYFDIEVIQALNHFIYQYKDQVDRITMDFMPDDLPVHLLCSSMRAGTKEVVKTKKPSRMIKIPDIEKLLRKLMTHSEKSLPEFLLTVEDPFIEKNNRTFWFRDNQMLTVDDRNRKGDIDHIRLNISDFVPLFTGYSSITEKYLQKKISVNNGTSSGWNQYAIPVILREIEFLLPPLQTYSTEFCY
ncbi:MAG TPA: GNAT family N-acetyltransferase [Thermotogota bacterium]|nr:GNAT family N-acetyltransferase [Thermotogota bacterium]